MRQLLSKDVVQPVARMASTSASASTSVAPNEETSLSSLSPLAQSAAREVWRYLRLGLDAQGGALRKADLILVLGSDDARVAEHAAALFRAGLAPRVLLSGKIGDITRGLYGAQSEAAFFADVCAARGVPREAMLLEERSTNTGENLAFSLQLLRERVARPLHAVVLLLRLQEVDRLLLVARVLLLLLLPLRAMVSPPWRELRAGDA